MNKNTDFSTLFNYMIDRICQTKSEDILTNSEMKRLIKIRERKKKNKN